MYKRYEDLLEKHKTTTYKVAKDTGISASLITKWKQGKLNPSLPTLQKLSAYFGVSLGYFTDGQAVFADSTGYKALQGFVTLPVIGQIRAGYPALAVENIIDYEQVPLNWTQNGEYFILAVKGDSMTDFGIFDGYRVLVKRQPTCENGEIAVVLVDGENATLKRVFISNNSQVELIPGNNKYPRMVFNAKDVTIEGVVKKVFFNL